MNKLSERGILSLLFVLLIVAFTLAGMEDYNQAVIEIIPEEAYMEIVAKLGAGCNNRDIVAEYEVNRVYYNSILND